MIRDKQECKKETIVSMKDGPGECEFTYLASKEEMLNRARLFSKIHLEKGCGIGLHKHEKETELFYILDGQAIYYDDCEKHVVKKGDVCICYPDHSHGIEAEDSTCDYLALIILE